MFLFQDSVMPDYRWRTSSHSGQGGSCIEAGQAPGVIVVRDTKDRDGPVLTVDAAAWRAFTGSLKA